MNNIEDIKNKWENTRLLEELPEDEQYSMSQLLENEAKLANICFPLIRRIFQSSGFFEEGDCLLTFTYETSVLPAFTYFKPDEEESSVATTQVYDFDFQMSKEEVEKIRNNRHNAIDGEVELTSILSEAFRNELNEKHKGKHLIFGYPIMMREEDGERIYSYRCAVLEVQDYTKEDIKNEKRLI
jgi:hypothetical protein